MLHRAKGRRARIGGDEEEETAQEVTGCRGEEDDRTD